MTTKHTGITVTVDGREWVVPSITRGELKRFRREGLFAAQPRGLESIGDNDETFVRAALAHNYSAEEVDGLIDSLTTPQLAEFSRAAVYATLDVQPPAEGEEGTDGPEA